MTDLLGGWDDGDAPLANVEPGFNQSFGEKLAGWAQTDTSLGHITGFDDFVDDKLGVRSTFFDTIDAAHRQTLYGSNIISRAITQEDAYDSFIKRAQSVTGVQLENPLRGGYDADVTKRIGLLPTSYNSGLFAAEAQKVFAEKLDALRRDPGNRDVANDLAFNLANQTRALTQRADVDAERAAAKPLNPVLRTGAALAGGITGSARDPLFLLSMAAGPAGAIGRNAALRMASAAFTQGAFNAGLSALEQPAVQAWRREQGLRNGVEPALEDVGMAFLAGAIPGAVIHGGVEAVQALRLRGLRAEAGRVINGGATVEEAQRVAEAMSPGTAGRDAPLFRQAAESDAADAAGAADRPYGVSQEAHDDALRQALRSAEDERLPPPEPPIVPREGEPLVSERVAQDYPGLYDPARPIESPGNRMAVGLSRLSDEAYGLARDLNLPADQAAAIGLLAPDPLTHAGIVDDLARAAVDSQRAARAIIGDAIARVPHAPEIEGRVMSASVAEPGEPKALEEALARHNQAAPEPTHDGIEMPATTGERDLEAADVLGSHADLVDACKEF